MTSWFKHYFPGNLRRNFFFTVCNYTSYLRNDTQLSIVYRESVTSYTGERVGQRGFLKALVTGIVTNRKQNILFQITGKIMFKTNRSFLFLSIVYSESVTS